ncbi:MAG: amidohydrolase [Sphaerochaetaceae bacterium]|nr:amidohydrolase [Sphaerochaetaceae bacterium]
MSVLLDCYAALITVDGKLTCLKDAKIGVEGKFIDYIGTKVPEKKYDSVKNLRSSVVIPGLVNAHGHSAMVHFRGLGNGLPLQDWLHLLWPIEDEMTDEDFESGMNLSILEALSCGTTSFTDMYMHASYVQKAVGESGIKANITRVMQNFDESTDYKTYNRRIEAFDLFKNYDGAYDGRLKIDFSIHAEYTNTEKVLQEFAQELKETEGARMHLHLSETKKEQEDCIKKYGVTPARWFERMGIFDIPTLAAHCVWCTDEDLQILKNKNVTVVHNPESNLKLGSGFAPVKKMLDMGINVALGTDGAASNNNLNMFEEMHTASIVHNGYLLDATAIKALDVLKMATINGAVAQGRDNCSSIEVGNCADMAAVSLEAPHMHPVLDIPALLTYSAQASDVCMTMVDGKILYENGEFYTLDREKVIFEAEKSVDKLCRNI